MKSNYSYAKDCVEKSPEIMPVLYSFLTLTVKSFFFFQFCVIENFRHTK